MEIITGNYNWLMIDVGGPTSLREVSQLGKWIWSYKKEGRESHVKQAASQCASLTSTSESLFFLDDGQGIK